MANKTSPVTKEERRASNRKNALRKKLPFRVKGLRGKTSFEKWIEGKNYPMIRGKVYPPCIPKHYIAGGDETKHPVDKVVPLSHKQMDGIVARRANKVGPKTRRIKVTRKQ